MTKILIPIFAIVISFFNSSFATPRCPNYFDIKKLELLEAIQHNFDPDVWNFSSEPLEHEGNKWNIWFGTFFPDVSDPKIALEKGKAFYKEADIVITNPQVYQSSQGYFLCDYMPPGHPYWISAVNPPAYSKMP